MHNIFVIIIIGILFLTIGLMVNHFQPTITETTTTTIFETITSMPTTAGNLQPTTTQVSTTTTTQGLSTTTMTIIAPVITTTPVTTTIKFSFPDILDINCQTNDDCPEYYECNEGKCWGLE